MGFKGKVFYSLILIYAFINQHADAADIDESFASEGTFIHDETSLLYSNVITDDGGQVLAGMYDDEDNNQFKILVVKLDQTGKRVPEFGANGVVHLALSPAGLIDWVYHVTLDKQERIYLAGMKRYDVIADTASAFVMRLSPNGQLDTGFGVNGVAEIASSAEYSLVDGLVVDGDAVLVSGHIRVASHLQAFVAKYSFAGRLDTNFGDAGIFRFSSLPGDTRFNTLMLQRDGKVVAAGTYEDAQGARVLLTRLLRDGSPDVSFGDGSGYKIASFDNSNWQFPAGLLQLPDEKFLMSFVTEPSLSFGYFGRRAKVVRLSPNGMLDLTFARNGLLALGGEDDALAFVTSFAEVGDGRVWVGGSTFKETTNGEIAWETSRQFLTRLTTEGEIDRTFTDSHWETFSKSGGNYVRANSLVLQADGSVLLAGTEIFNVRSGVVTRFKGVTLDTLPETVSLATLTNVAQSSLVVSDDVVISGLGVGVVVPTRIENGEISVNGGAFSSNMEWVRNSDIVRIRHTASALANTTVTSRLLIGGRYVATSPAKPLGEVITVSFSSVTQASVPTPQHEESSSGGGGAFAGFFMLIVLGSGLLAKRVKRR